MKEIKYKLQEKPRYLYYGILLAYLVSLGTIFTLRVTADTGAVNVETHAVGQYVGLGRNDLTVTDLIYNPETEIVEVDVYIQKDLTAIEPLPQYEFAGLTFEDTSTYLPQEVIHVKDNYYALFFGNVPDNFQALSITVAEVPEEGEQIQNATKIRYMQEDFTVEPDFVITEDLLHYEEKAIDFEIAETEKQIADNQLERERLEERIQQFEQKIRENEAEKKYLLTEEQAELEAVNTKMLNDIVEMEQEIKDLAEQNTQLQEKIELTKQKKSDLQT